MPFYACDVLTSYMVENDRLAKSAKGEGSRGGKIIGHTKSGKPVYDTSHSHYAMELNHSKMSPLTTLRSDGHKDLRDRYDDYTKQDHLDASEIHSDLGQKTRSVHKRAIASAEKQTFGRKLSFLDRHMTGGYGVTGGHPKMSAAHNAKLRSLVDRAQDHERASSLHSQAAKLRYFGGNGGRK